MTTKVIHIAGADGVGKTTLSKHLLNHLVRKGFSAKLIYFRYPRVITYFLLAVCRCLGLTISNHRKGSKFWYRRIYKFNLLRFLYPYFIFIDIFISYNIILKKYKNYDYIIFERFVIDTLVDITLETKNTSLLYNHIGEKIIDFRDDTKTIIVDLDYDSITERRPEIKKDVWQKNKLQLFRLISKIKKIKMIRNNTSVERTSENLISQIS